MAKLESEGGPTSGHPAAPGCAGLPPDPAGPCDVISATTPTAPDPRNVVRATAPTAPDPRNVIRATTPTAPDPRDVIRERHHPNHQVRGNRNVNTDPRPSVERTLKVPPIKAHKRRQIASPSPVPS